MKIGFIGLGNMGLPMAKNLLKAGFDVVGLNRSKEAEKRFLEVGGKISSSISILAKEMDVVITCLPLPTDVRDVYLNEGGLLLHGHEDLVVIDCSTVSPSLNRELYGELLKRGIHYLDAPVSGGTSGAKAGTLSIMVGGDENIFQKVKTVFEGMGKKVNYIGSSGSGSLVKLINQLMVALHTQAVSEALALAKRNGLDMQQTVDVLSASLAQSSVLQRHFNDFIAKEEYTPGFALNLLSKDLGLVSELASESKVQIPLGSRINNLVKRACQMDLKNKDMSAMMEYQLQQDEKGRSASPVKTFAVFLPMKDVEKSQVYRSEHLKFLDKRRNEGVLHANGRFVDGAGGLVIYYGHSQKEVEELVKQDPYIINGARDYEIHEWDMVPGL
ncbi:3-hydroxyisobutyrate dehydrogenase [Evansella vedderi]|uniref:3-hydroxyisobutyrate dehydrogenase n=1 Tax=Evansella vedderi TaxID=38282 RepID=A0ABT9ZQ05_9BACI|nr:NAD(P)-binding domain-containing protein [Evansella vedderi]MDQ0253320.1 3-hydroxyisobutyrate dehydrogenase [Evansella vedderi]